jgi:methylase of polypeptide subunit release factors
MHQLFPTSVFNEFQSNYCGVVDGQVTRLVHDSFPWESLKAGKVVDIGGGSGHISIALARVR